MQKFVSKGEKSEFTQIAGIFFFRMALIRINRKAFYLQKWDVADESILTTNWLFKKCSDFLGVAVWEIWIDSQLEVCLRNENLAFLGTETPNLKIYFQKLNFSTHPKIFSWKQMALMKWDRFDLEFEAGQIPRSYSTLEVLRWEFSKGYITQF